MAGTGGVTGDRGRGGTGGPEAGVRLLHLADVHLGAPLGGFGEHGEERARQILEAFRRVPDLAEEHGAEAVLLTGDLFDGPRPDDAVLAAVQEVDRRLAEAGVHAFAVPGNHDGVALDPTLYPRALPEASAFLEATFGDPATVELPGGALHVYGFAHDPAEAPDPLASWRRDDADGFHVALLHGSVPDAPHWEEGSALRLPPERLAELGADYLALGDYHRHRPPGSFGDGVPACYAGSFAAVDLAETGPHGAVLVELRPGAPPRVRLLPSGVPEVGEPREFDVAGHGDEEAVAAAVGDRLEEGVIPRVRLTGEPSFPLDAEKVRVRLRERFGYARVEDATRFFASAHIVELAERKTVAGHVARLGLERIEAAPEGPEREAAERGLRIALRHMEVR